MKAYIFDFDGTLGRTLHYHRAGWDHLLKDLMINKSLDSIFPPDRGMYERFDSYPRIKKGFLDSPEQTQYLINRFGEGSNIPQEIMNLKESYTLSQILSEDIGQTMKNMSLNLAAFLDHKASQRSVIGVISSSRKMIVSIFLDKVGVLDYFDFVIGEEDMYDGNILNDKPHRKAAQGMGASIEAMESKIYYGDDKIIDSVFAHNIGAEFRYANHKTDFLTLIDD